MTVTGAIVLVACAAALPASVPPPQLPPGLFAGTPLQHAPPTGGATLGALRVTFGKTTLAQIAHAAGRGAVRHQGDAGSSLHYLCYDRAGTDYRERIWLVADAEMGGAAQAVTAIIATRLPARHAAAACEALPRTLAPVSFDSQLWLGAHEKSVESALGAPSHRDGHSQSFTYAGKTAGQCPGGFDVTAWLTTQEDGGRVEFIAAGLTTTC